MRVRPNYSLERGLWSRGVTAIAEVDEVGVGALAGPVVAAAAILAPNVTVDDKRRIAGCRFIQTPVIDGDARSASIAAASIVAKVTRDARMTEYGRCYPEYGFERRVTRATRRPLTLAHWVGSARWRCIAVHAHRYGTPLD